MLPTLTIAVLLGPHVLAQEPAPVDWTAKRLAFEMRDKPWHDVLTWFAAEAGMPYSCARKPTGRFTFVNAKDKAPYSLVEIFDLLNEALISQEKLVLIRGDRELRLVAADEEDLGPVPRIKVEELPRRGHTEIVEIVLKLNPTDDADELAREIVRILRPFGRVTPVKQSNELIVRGTVIQLLRNAFSPCGEKAQNKDAPVDWTEKRIAFEIHDQAWHDVLTWFAVQAKMPYSSAYKPPGTCRFASKDKLFSLIEIQDILNDVLERQHKHVLLRGRNELRLISLDDDRDWLPPRIKIEELSQYSKYAVVELAVKLKPDANIDEGVPELTRLLRPFGKVTVLPGKAEMIIRANVAALRRNLDLIAPLSARAVPLRERVDWTEKRIAFEMNAKQWGPVLAWFADQAKMPISTTYLPTGTFSYFSPQVNGKQRLHSLLEIYDILNEALQRSNNLLLLGDNVMALVPLDEIQSAVALTRRVDELPRHGLPQRGRTEFVEVSFSNLSGKSTENVARELRRRLGVYSHVTPFNNRLNVLARAGAIDRNLDYINELRTPPAAAPLCEIPGRPPIRRFGIFRR